MKTVTFRNGKQQMEIKDKVHYSSYISAKARRIYNLLCEKAERRWQTDILYLFYLSPTTAITAKISNAHAFIYSQNPIMPVAPGKNAFYTHYCGRK